MGHAVASANALSRMLEPICECLNEEAAKRILELRTPPDILTRVEELADKSNEGLLTETERAEYQGYVDGADLIAILKAKARELVGPGRTS